MEDIFQIIDHVIRTEEWNREFFKPNFKPAQPGLQVNEVNLGKTTRYRQTYDQCGSVIISGATTDNKGVHSRKAKGNHTTKMVPRN